MAPTLIDCIRAKRDHQELSSEQIHQLVDSYRAETFSDSQMSALLMAAALNGMSADEVSAWTSALVATGERLDLSAVGRPTVDKYSTGGVGDKVSLILAPLIAACGAAVPQFTGRALAHTGATLDKLRSLEGWRGQFGADELVEQLRTVGAFIAQLPDDVVPVDRRLAALRAETATVQCVPMIAATMMSRKIAEGTGALVIDVKVGSGAFIRDATSAAQLARTMIRLGEEAGIATSALLTDMSEPLGHAVGNAIEVAEAIEVLAGGGPVDVVELTLALAREMTSLVGISTDPADVLASGAAMDCWRAMIAAQGADPDAPLPQAAEVEIVPAQQDGVVSKVDARAVGVAATRLESAAAAEGPGALAEGLVAEAKAVAGVLCRVKPGDEVTVGSPLFELHAASPQPLAAAAADLAAAVDIVPAGGPVPRRAIVLKTIRSA